MFKKLIAIIPALVIITSAGAAGAVTTQKDCEAAGGTYSNNRGTKTCVMPVEETDPSGNSGNAWTVRGNHSESQQGAIDNQGTSETNEESTTTTSCSNPGGHEMKLSSNKCQL